MFVMTGGCGDQPSAGPSTTAVVDAEVTVPEKSALRFIGNDTYQWVITNGKVARVLADLGGGIQVTDWRFDDFDNDGRGDEAFLFLVEYGAPVWHVAIVSDSHDECRAAVLKIGITGHRKQLKFSPDFYSTMLDAAVVVDAADLGDS